MEMGIETLRARGLGPEARGGKKDTFSVASFSPKTNSLARSLLSPATAAIPMHARTALYSKADFGFTLILMG
jgi:hypothetical protein